MDWEYKRNKLLTQVELGGKVYSIDNVWIDATAQKLEISEFEAIEMWLDDRDLLEPIEEQEELQNKAKENKSNKIIKAKNETQEPKPKATRERKPNPLKELIIAEIASFLPTLNGVTALKVENIGKIITFTIDSREFKIDLTEKRVKKS